MSLVWFGPIADESVYTHSRAVHAHAHIPLAVHEFGFTLDEVNWLGNCINLAFLPCAVIVPMFYSCFGLRRTVSIQARHEHIATLTFTQLCCFGKCYIGGILLIVSAWVRYAGTAKSLSVGGAYSLVITGQVSCLSLSQVRMSTMASAL